MSRKYKFMLLGYLCLLVVVGLYVWSVLNIKVVEVSEKDDPKKVEKVRQVNVQLNIKDPTGIRTYTTKVNNTDSIYDALNNLRKEKLISFELIEYSYGTEIESINNRKSDANNHWVLYINDLDYTNVLKETNLSDDTNVTLTFEAKDRK